MACGDGLDNAAFAGLIREFARRPMADGTPRRLRGRTGQGDDLAPLLLSFRQASLTSHPESDTRAPLVEPECVSGVANSLPVQRAVHL
jgi:hypothetical protein